MTDKERLSRKSVMEAPRWQTMGLAGNVLFVVYTERGDDTKLIFGAGYWREGKERYEQHHNLH